MAGGPSLSCLRTRVDEEAGFVGTWTFNSSKALLIAPTS